MLFILLFYAVKTRVMERVAEPLPITTRLALPIRHLASRWLYQPVVHAVRVRSCTVAGDAEPLALLRSGATAPITLVGCHPTRLLLMISTGLLGQAIEPASLLGLHAHRYG